MPRLTGWRARGAEYRGAFAITDQAVVSFGNFATNLLLIRNLEPHTFGVYAVLWSVLLLLNTLQSSLIVHPMLVLGASVGPGHARRLATCALCLTLAFTIPGMAVLLAATAILGRLDLFVWVAPALLAWQLQEVLRRALMAQRRYAASISGDALSYIGQAAAIFFIHTIGTLSLASLFGCMTATSLLAAALQWTQIRPVKAAWRELAESAREFWQLGRWIANLNIVGSVTTTVLPWALAFVRGPVELAGYQALLYVVGIVQPLTFGMGALLNVEIARSASRGELPSALRTILRPVVAGAIAIALYGCAVAAAPASVLGLLFRSRSPYLHLAPELRLFVLASLLGYAGQMLSEMLIGLRETRAAFISQCWSSAACIAAGLPLLYVTGALGAVIGLVAAHLARIVAVGTFLRGILSRVGDSATREPFFASDSIAVGASGIK